jgi:hypothetical protein
MAVTILSADIGFVYCDDVHKSRKILILHRCTYAMAHIPCGLFSLETHDALNVEGSLRPFFAFSIRNATINHSRKGA